MRRIVYIASNPATLARDVNELLPLSRYSGVADMFPHTSTQKIICA
jgi:tRNA/tmRNA/rRNA uracil-C5-methylase (TrmA/RlmC/RlmD family)